MERTALRKVKGFIGVLMIFVLAFVSFPWSTSVKAEEKKQEKASEKKLVFPVVSDVHIKTVEQMIRSGGKEQLNSLIH